MKSVVIIINLVLTHAHDFRKYIYIFFVIPAMLCFFLLTFAS